MSAALYNPIKAECLDAIIRHVGLRADARGVPFTEADMTRRSSHHILLVFAETLAAYIRLNARAEGEHDKNHKYSATLPSGETIWGASARELAERILGSVEG